jgi:hypothetical protein
MRAQDKQGYHGLLLGFNMTARQDEIKQLLIATDNVALRSFKYGLFLPEDWWQYTQDLRAAYNNDTLPIPTQPPYPDNI